MKTILTFLFLGTFTISAQGFISNDTITLTRNQAEAIFLEKNLLLLSEKLNIDKAQAQIIQAKLWPNPTLTINEINLWSNATSEQLPVLWGDFGKTSEIAVGLEQLIITAGKRKKMVAMEKVTAEMSVQYFEDLLRNLKVEFRNNLTELQYLQQQETIYRNQLTAIQKLISSYKNQVTSRNLGKSEYVRLKASELEFVQELSQVQKEINRLQKELKIIMNLPSPNYIKISMEGFVPDIQKMESINLGNAIENALNKRPDIKAVKLETEYSNNRYKYERSLAVPDITLQASYDRGGNIMHNFVGFGLSFDIPFFNRNQGNIKQAKIAIEQSEIAIADKTLRIQSEIINTYSDLITVKKLYENLDPDYEKDLDLLLESHLKNFTLRNISLLEYLDYINAYIENKKIILSFKKDLNIHFEELQFVTAQELN